MSNKDNPSLLSPGLDLPELPSPEAPWRPHLVILGLLLAIAALLYYPSLHAPWYMDDFKSIVENPSIRDLGGSFRGILQPRGLAMFTFALNYHFGRSDPLGYHLVNIGLHLGCSFVVYLLLQRLMRGSLLLPALGALLFVAHPLQTQAVTYIVQRMAVLAALFFLLALWLFVRSRERLAAGVPFASNEHLRFYLGALVAGLAAIFTKENTAVLPVVLYLYVTVLLPPAGDRRRLVFSLLPFVIGPLVLASVKLFIPLTAGAALTAIAGTSRLPDAQYLSPLHYLVTEFSVLWIYIRMLFLPYGQTLEYGYPVAVNLFEWRHFVAGGGLLLLGALAVLLRRRQPLISAGIAWYFLTLAVESSFIPLDPLFEHRLYLPMFGFLLVVLGLLRRLATPRTGAALLLALVLVSLPLTWQRNRLWANPVAFEKDNLAKVHENAAVLSDQVSVNFDAGHLGEAEEMLLRALKSNPDAHEAYSNLAAVYSRQGRMPEAFALARQGLERDPNSVTLLTSLGALYYKSGDVEHALQSLDQALAISPEDPLALKNLAAILAQTGRLPEAEEAFRKALAMDEANVLLRNDLALALKKQGKNDEAEKELQRIIEIDPENNDALFRLGLLAGERGDRTLAGELAERLRQSDPQRAQELKGLIEAGR